MQKRSEIRLFKCKLRYNYLILKNNMEAKYNVKIVLKYLTFINIEQNGFKVISLRTQ
mgnify:CR=1 FL=1